MTPVPNVTNHGTEQLHERDNGHTGPNLYLSCTCQNPLNMPMGTDVLELMEKSRELWYRKKKRSCLVPAAMNCRP